MLITKEQLLELTPIRKKGKSNSDIRYFALNEQKVGEINKITNSQWRSYKYSPNTSPSNILVNNQGKKFQVKRWAEGWTITRKK